MAFQENKFKWLTYSEPTFYILLAQFQGPPPSDFPTLPAAQF
jgi:hypothetical protein